MLMFPSKQRQFYYTNNPYSKCGPSNTAKLLKRFLTAVKLT